MGQKHIGHPSNSSRIHIFSNTMGTFSRMDDMIGHETNLNKFKIEITSAMFPATRE